MSTRAKVGLAIIVLAVVVGVAGLVLLFKDYVDLVYAESGRVWSPALELGIAPLLALALLGVGLIMLLTAKRQQVHD